MGRYVNTTSRGFIGRSMNEKCDGIIADGGKEISTPRQFVNNLVVVVDNGHMGTAKFVETPRDLEVSKVNDGRKKRWFVWNNVEEFAE